VDPERQRGARPGPDRDPALIAYNVNLASRKVAAARAIAGLNLRHKTPFDWRQRVIEERLRVLGWIGD
jgi:hypothetical protein